MTNVENYYLNHLKETVQNLILMLMLVDVLYIIWFTCSISGNLYSNVLKFPKSDCYNIFLKSVHQAPSKYAPLFGLPF